MIAGVKTFDTDGWTFEATGETAITDSVDMREDNAGVMVLTNYRGFSISALYTQSEQDNLGPGARWPFSSQALDHLLLDVGYKHAIGSSWNADYHLTYNGSAHGTLGNDKQNTDDVLAELMVTGELRDNINILLGTLYEPK